MTEQKLQDDAINLIDNILDDNPFKNIDTGDFWKEDRLFDNNDGQDIKDISKEITDVNEPLVDDFESPIETIRLDDDIDIPSDDKTAIDMPKKIKLISDPNKLHLVSNRINKNIFTKNEKV